MHLQFITSAPDAETTASQACEAMAGGCRWVQVRMKDAPDSEAEQAVRLIAPEARRHGAVLIVDDRVELAARMPEIDGVHLGHNDMPRPEARVILGSGKIMGSTANTPEQALALAPLSDYLGVGPFRYTTTKKNLAPILGVDGLARVMTSLTAAGEFLPVVAIGGITPSDIETVMRTGVTGVALSGVIIGAADPVAKTQEIIKKLHIHE
ncbi:MAG: thiamine phosphate synthase [Muribaculaceae bacterium]|nr:thiamine phosphate synthase [Muribaculaceae bacterium]